MNLVHMKCNILSNTFNIKTFKKAQKDKESQGHFLTFDLLSGIVVLVGLTVLIIGALNLAHALYNLLPVLPVKRPCTRFT